jgi:hypothetical protein
MPARRLFFIDAAIIIKAGKGQKAAWGQLPHPDDVAKFRRMADEHRETMAPGPASAESSRSGPAAIAAEAPSSPEGSTSVPASAATDGHSRSPRDEFDPMGWEVPVICKDCNKGFKLPYRHFQVGMVFHCPHCHGSFVPNMTMHRAVHEAFENFWKQLKLRRNESAGSGRDKAEFLEIQRREIQEFQRVLEKLAQELRPAGKLVKRGWWASMFT